ncbi:MAG: hypothetical protein E3J21_23680 [Anaerolineales bacterium]|nr:MAG: hypothetical protein E3J21_23680 [Anaerolineales bacterium]
MKSVVFVFLLFLIFTRDAHAYLDPGTGSYILQLIIAGLLGASLVVKIYWGNIKTFFSNLFSKGQSEEDDNE